MVVATAAIALVAGFVNVALRNLFGRVGIDLITGPLDVHSWYGLIFAFVLYQVPFAFLMVSAGPTVCATMSS